MDDIVQHSVNDLARALEPLAVQSWPARETRLLNGWLLRFSDGYSSRCNSVSTLEFDGRIDSAIEAVEAAYHARGLAPQFQISPASQPHGLEAALVRRGYRHKPPTVLMIAEAADIAAPIGEVQILATPGADFARLTLEGSHSPEDGAERLATLARITLPRAYVVARSGSEIVSCGASVATGNWASVYVMRTSASHRRMGHGSRVLQAIANWARGRGATKLYLQVDESNAPGRALYARAGFRDGYRYLHYCAPEAPK
ncbi:MAG: GNAT family N-acetyltransferase [Rhizomicrobium sp.]